MGHRGEQVIRNAEYTADLARLCYDKSVKAPSMHYQAAEPTTATCKRTLVHEMNIMQTTKAAMPAIAESESTTAILREISKYATHLLYYCVDRSSSTEVQLAIRASLLLLRCTTRVERSHDAIHTGGAERLAPEQVRKRLLLLLGTATGVAAAAWLQTQAGSRQTVI
jgi:hypothetical protein